jgi:hypothetical protein
MMLTSTMFVIRDNSCPRRGVVGYWWMPWFRTR